MVWGHDEKELDLSERHACQTGVPAGGTEDREVDLSRLKHLRELLELPNWTVTLTSGY